MAYIRFGLDNPEQYKVLFIEPQLNPVSTEEIAKWACLQDMVDAVQRGIDQGLVEGPDAFVVTAGLWAYVHGLVSLLITKPGLPWPPIETLIDHVLDTAYVGIAPRAI